MRGIRTVSAALAVATAMAMVGLASAPAHAAGKDGWCDIGELCLWYSPNYSGSVIDFYAADREHLDDRFISWGAGQGRVVANNAASAINLDQDFWARISNKPRCSGPENFHIPPGGRAPNLLFMRNDNRSNCWPFIG
jgi:hypothetical protein